MVAVAVVAEVALALVGPPSVVVVAVVVAVGVAYSTPVVAVTAAQLKVFRVALAVL